MKVDIRRALDDESEKLSLTAHAAKRHWGYPENWIEQWKPQLTVTPEFIRNNRVYAALSGDEVAGFYGLIEHHNKVELEHLWVLPEYMGKGVGRALFEHAVRVVRLMNIAEIEILADPNAEGFYSRMGAKKIGEVASEIDGEKRVLPLLKLEIGKGFES